MTSAGTAAPADKQPHIRSNPEKVENKARIYLLDCDRLASWLGVDVGFVRRLVAERRVPFIKIGKFVRFDPTEVSKWLDGQRVAVVPRKSSRVSW